MPITELISLIRQGTVSGSKSTVLSPLMWGVGILATAIVGGARTAIPPAILGVLTACLVLMILGLLAGFAYFAWKDPEALRTERYKLTKLAIEQYMSGDDDVGLALVDPTKLIGAVGPESRAEVAVLPPTEAKSSKRQTKPAKPAGGPEP